MTDLVTEFAKLLDTERTYALRADVQALAAIQDDKRALLDRLLQSGAPAEQTAALREQALLNVQLIRHLVGCLQGLCTSPETTTYTAGGARPAAAMSRFRGHL